MSSQTTNGREQLLWAKDTPNGFAPSKGSDNAAGYDLRSAYKTTVPARQRQIISTDIIIQVPAGTYGRLASRSKLACEHGIDVAAGIIDPDFRGVVCVVLANHSDRDFEVSKGDRIAQLICERIAQPSDVVEVEKADLSRTSRGERGLGRPFHFE